MSVDITKALARTTDPVQSHRAAAAVKVKGVRAGVLYVLRGYGDGCDGTDVNERYVYRTLGVRPSWWATCKFDTPRKRLSELRDEGLITPVKSASGSEQKYVLSITGRDALDAWEQKQAATK